jgi:hypothetical protein
VKNTANYIVGKFNHKMNTIRTISKLSKKAKSKTDSPLSYRASLFDKENYFRPLEKQNGEMIELNTKNDDEEIYEKYEKYTPTDFYNHHSLLFPKAEEKPLNEPCLFDRVKFSNINNAISGRRQHKMLKNVYFTIKTTNIQNLYEPTNFDVLKRNSLRRKKQNNVDVEMAKNKMDLTALLQSTNPDEKTEYELLKDYFDSMSFSEIIRDKDFKNYLRQKNYQDAIDYIYSDSLLSSIRGDKSSVYSGLKKMKNLPSITSDILKRYYDIDLDIITESNDCDSIKHEKERKHHNHIHNSKSVDRRKYYNKENSEFFCKSNKEFDDYYKRNTKIFYEANKKIDDNFFRKDSSDYYETVERNKEKLKYYNKEPYYYEDPPNESEIDELYNARSGAFVYSTMPMRGQHCRNKKCPRSVPQKTTQIVDFEDADETDNLFKKYQTYPQKKKPKNTYNQILKYCEKSLTTYTTIDKKMEKLRKSRMEYSEKSYNKIIKAFVRLRGFESVDSYVQYHYGRILDKSFDNDLRSRLKETFAAHDEQFVESYKQRPLEISKPILTTTTQTAVLANPQMDSLPPPYSSGSFFNDDNSVNGYFYKKIGQFAPGRRAKYEGWTYEDCFKNYNYVDHQHSKKSSHTSIDEPNKRVLFKFVEDMKMNDIKLEHLFEDRLDVKPTIEHNNNSNYYRNRKNEKCKIEYYNNNNNKSKIINSNEANSPQTPNDDNLYESIYVESSNNKNEFALKYKNNNKLNRQQHVDGQRKHQRISKENPIVISYFF